MYTLLTWWSTVTTHTHLSLYHVYKNYNKVSSLLFCLTFILYMLRIVALGTTQRNVGLQIAGTCSWSFSIKCMYNSYAWLALSLYICRVHNWMNSIKIWIVCCIVNNTTYFWVIFSVIRIEWHRRISYTSPPPRVSEIRSQGHMRPAFYSLLI